MKTLFTTLTNSQPKFLCVVAVGFALCVLSACIPSVTTSESQRLAQRFEPTGQPVAFDSARYNNFDDYVKKTQDYLSAHKVYFNPENAAEELQVAMPFSVKPHQITSNTHCESDDKPTRGIVLIHGLSDMPAAMKDTANAFAERCFVVYSMLLPGHGARPAEMLNVSREDWLAVARFGVDTMRTEVDEVYVGGYSLGGLIALQTAGNDTDISGVFAFSPALALHRSAYLNQTIWLRHMIEWLDTDPPDDPWRFEAIPFNALAETQLLARSVRAQLKEKTLKTPVFIAQSPDDAVVDATVNQSFFEHHMIHSASRLLSYTSNNVQAASDSRILKYPSVLLEQRILSYSHQAVHIAPENPHYGIKGTYRSCNNDVNVNSVLVDHCLTVETPFRGEVFGNAVNRYDFRTIESLARLTFNPQFSQLFDEVDLFLDALSPDNNVVRKVLSSHSAHPSFSRVLNPNAL